MGIILPARWNPLRYHPIQHQLVMSSCRFNVVPAGRRSGKTELAKRRLVIRSLAPTIHKFPGRFFAAAPTRDQAKRIFWDDLKSMIPPDFIVGKPSETELLICLINGARIYVVGMDKPERIEGSPWDGGILDEYGNMKEKTWREHVRPALADRNGWVDCIGVPEGRNHYYDLYQMALEDENPEWGGFHWISADILPPEEIEAAKKDLDELTYQQEYEGSFVNFAGQTYYPFDRNIHVEKLEYIPDQELIFNFDFNIAPGTATVAQEQQLPSGHHGTAIISEAYIPRNSDTLKICDRLIQEFPQHEEIITCYGDATGGAGGTAKVSGSDWDLIKEKLTNYYGEDQIQFHVPRGNPAERKRINCVNSRLKSIKGDIHLMVDSRCKHTIKDFEGVRSKDDGKIDKTKDMKLSHLTDGIGYYIAKEFPFKRISSVHQVSGA